MTRRSLIGWLVATLVLLGAGCGSPALKPKREVTLALEVGKTKTVFPVKVGDLLTLELPPVDLAGFGWQVFMKDARFLQQRTEVIPPKTQEGRPTVKFLALAGTGRAANGRTTVRFLLIKQDGSRETQPIDGYDVIFTID
jgi:hypothetical protein